jgi:hypothetical protein
MPSKPPRFVPTLALAVLWLALYFVWVAVRPTEPTTATKTEGRTATTSSTTPTTTPPLFKLKP